VHLVKVRFWLLWDKIIIWLTHIIIKISNAKPYFVIVCIISRAYRLIVYMTLYMYTNQTQYR
jgi:hypothetical protein